MKPAMKERIPHGEEGHFCHGGCAGYAEGGEVTAGIAGIDKNPSPVIPERSREGVAGVMDDKDPSEIPEHIREFIEQTHKDRQESRPDENWRIQSAPRGNTAAPYKKDEEDKGSGVLDELKNLMGFSGGGSIPGYDDGGQAPDPNALLSQLEPAGAGIIAPSIARPAAAPAIPAPASPDMAEAPAPVPRAPAASALTDQDFMDRANKMLGLNPQEQAGFMKMLGANAQKAQLGSALAGIGDAIAAGGTLGKVNPGALNKSEELIQGRTKEGLEGLQSIREGQGKAMEVADKLEARDPQSPLSKWAQKAYAGVGKKIGLNLDNASAALIGDVTGKGVDALNTEYQNQLKMMGLDLQKKQVEATIGNQKAEREIAREGHQLEASKALADQGLLKKAANFFSPGQKTLETAAKGSAPVAPDVAAYAQKHGITIEQAQAIKDKRTGGQ